MAQNNNPKSENENIQLPYKTIKNEANYDRDAEALSIQSEKQNLLLQKEWGRYLKVYSTLFTCAVFFTLWNTGTLFTNIKESTLNTLIGAGFVQVIGVVWIIVKYLFPANGKDDTNPPRIIPSQNPSIIPPIIQSTLQQTEGAILRTQNIVPVSPINPPANSPAQPKPPVTPLPQGPKGMDDI